MHLTDKAIREQEELFRLRAEAIYLLGQVVAEWVSDPLSVQCFDLRMVERSKCVLKRIKELDLFMG